MKMIQKYGRRYSSTLTDRHAGVMELWDEVTRVPAFKLKGLRKIKHRTSKLELYRKLHPKGVIK
jgi:hypothetical protein